jgi:hypothetical protein
VAFIEARYRETLQAARRDGRLPEGFPQDGQLVWEPGGSRVAAYTQPHTYHYRVWVFDAAAGRVVASTGPMRNAEEADGPWAESSFYASTDPEISWGLEFPTDAEVLRFWIPGTPNEARAQLPLGRHPGDGAVGPPEPEPVEELFAACDGRWLISLHPGWVAWRGPADGLPRRWVEVDTGGPFSLDRGARWLQVKGGVVDLEAGARTEHPAIAAQASLNPDGSLVLALEEGGLVARDPRSGEERWRRPHPDPQVSALAWHPDGASYFTHCPEASLVRRFSAEDGAEVESWPLSRQRVFVLGAEHPAVLIPLRRGFWEFPQPVIRRLPSDPIANVPPGRFDLLEGTATKVPVSPTDVTVRTPGGWVRCCAGGAEVAVQVGVTPEETRPTYEGYLRAELPSGVAAPPTDAGARMRARVPPEFSTRARMRPIDGPRSSGTASGAAGPSRFRVFFGVALLVLLCLVFGALVRGALR